MVAECGGDRRPVSDESPPASLFVVMRVVIEEAPILIDVRGSSDTDPAIPGSKRVYLLDIEERTEAFEKRFAPQMANRSLLLYCSKGEGATSWWENFPGNIGCKACKAAWWPI